MKKVQKFILPLLGIAAVIMIYIFYFSPAKRPGTFDEIDKDAHIQKEVKVRILQNEGIDRNSSPEKAFFNVLDAKGVRARVAVNKADLPLNIDKADLITIIGHFHGQIFDAVEIIVH